MQKKTNPISANEVMLIKSVFLLLIPNNGDDKLPRNYVKEDSIMQKDAAYVGYQNFMPTDNPPRKPPSNLSISKHVDFAFTLALLPASGVFIK